MPQNSKRAFVMASLVHVAFALLVLTFTLWRPPERKPKPIVFELVAPPAPGAEVAEAEVVPVAFNFTPPEPPPPPPPRPRPVEPPPAPTPPPPPPTPPPPPPRPTPAPAPKPPPPKPPEPEKIAFDQFRQQNPQRPTPPRPQPTPAPAPAPVPRIDTTQITRDLNATITSPRQQAQASQQSASDQAALQSYFERIKAAVRGAWAKPHGLHDQLRVEIRFDVRAAGVISGFSVASSSGNSIFDQSVLDAFARVGSVGAPPDRKPYSLRLEFRMTD
jgi:TonB family protein